MLLVASYAYVSTLTYAALEVVEVFPCKCDVTDATQSKQTEKEVSV